MRKTRYISRHFTVTLAQDDALEALKARTGRAFTALAREAIDMLLEKYRVTPATQN